MRASGARRQCGRHDRPPPKARRIRTEGLPVAAPAPTPHLLESLAYAYRYTGEVKYLKLATRVFAALERGEATAHGTAKFVDESGAVIAGHGGGRIFASTYPSVLLYAAEAAPAGLLDWYEYPY